MPGRESVVRSRIATIRHATSFLVILAGYFRARMDLRASRKKCHWESGLTQRDGANPGVWSKQSSVFPRQKKTRPGVYRTRATGVVAPPAPQYFFISHGEEFEERVRLASEAAERFDLYVELLCLEAVDRVVVEYSDVSVGWVQQQQKQLEQHEQFEQQQQLELQQLVQRQRKKLKVHQNWEESLWVLVSIIQDRSLRCRVCVRWGALSCVSWMSTRT